MYPTDLGYIYSQMIWSPITVILVFFLPLFIFIYSKLKKNNARPIIKNSFYVAYPMLVLMLFLDVIVAPLKFRQMCRDLAGFHGEPFPRGEGLVLPENTAMECSTACRAYIEAEGVVFIEEELIEPPNSKRLQVVYQQIYEPLKLGIKLLPGKYRYNIHLPDEPICSDKVIQTVGSGRETGNILDAIIKEKYYKYCLTWEKIDEFTANYTYKFSTHYLPGFFKSSIKKTGFWTEDLRNEKVVGEYNAFSLSFGLFSKITNSFLPVEEGFVAHCGLPLESSGKLFSGWK